MTRELELVHETSFGNNFNTIKYYCYGNDTQVYMTSKPSDNLDDISSSTAPCIADMGILMDSNNLLKLNIDNTAFIVKKTCQENR